MKPILLLILAQARRQRGRLLTTTLAVAIAVAGVGFNLMSLSSTHQRMLENSQQLGRFDALILPRTMGGKVLPQELVAAMRADEAVADADAAVSVYNARVVHPPLPPGRGPLGGTRVIGSDAPQPSEPLEAGAWLGADPTVAEAVVSSTFAASAKLAVGDSLVVTQTAAPLRLRVVGILRLAERTGPRLPILPPPHHADIWVHRSQAAALGSLAEQPNLVGFALRDGADVQAFVDRWEDRCYSAYPPAELRSTVGDAQDFIGNEESEMGAMLNASSTFLWTLVVGFVIFLSVSVGARARLRQFAVLRALALSRTQAVVLVCGEALSLGLVGWLLGNILLSAGTNLLAPQLMDGLVPPPMILGISLGCTLVGSLLAALGPTWQVTTSKPIDLLRGVGQKPARQIPVGLTVAGLALIVVNPAIVMLGRHEPVREVLGLFHSDRVGFYTPVFGSLLMILGFAFLTPLVIKLSERLFGPATAGLFRLDRRFLRQQLSRNLGRSVGTTTALSAGLALYITSLVWGFSMLVPFMPTEVLPRMQVHLEPAGVTLDAVDAVAEIPGVDGARFLPTITEQPRLSQATLESPGFAHIHDDMQHVLVMGVDPARAFGGSDPLFDLELEAGDRAGLVEELRQPGRCVIPDHFATHCGLALGDSFSVVRPGDGQEVEYTVAAIASMPGWNWLTKMSGARSRAIRAVALLLVDFEQASRDYALDRVKHFWFDLTPDGPLATARPPAPTGPGGARGMFGSAVASALEAAVEPLALTQALPRIAPLARQAGVDPAELLAITITDRDGIRTRLAGHGGRTIWSFTILPLVMLLISSLAVCNAILASVRGRSWQFGILRSIGMTRGQLMRLVLSESLQLWVATALLSVVAGVSLGWAGTRLSSLFFFFAGHTPDLVVPWTGIGIGLAVGLVVCVGAALLPAWLVARKKPLQFIQAGRLAQ